MKRPIDKKQQKTHRRDFLKKAIYATPTVIVLGSIIKPIKANADDFGATPSDPDTQQ